MRPVYLYEQASTLELTAAELREVDPQLNTLRNLNRPEDYLAARGRGGLHPRPGSVARAGATV